MTTTNYTKPATTHTPEPWAQDSNELFAVTADKDGLIVAETEIHDRTDEECYANARRIVAAVNACEGISTEALEQGAIAELLLQLRVLVDHVQSTPHELTEALRKLRLKEARTAIAQAKGGRP
jgi:hypothetical protein